VRVQIRTPDDRPPGFRAQVELLNVSAFGPALDTTYSDSSGRATLRALRAGYYRVRITAPDVEETLSEEFSIHTAGTSQYVMVTVRPKPDRNAANPAPGGMVSAAALKVPGKARKENEKGIKQAKESHWAKAIEHFRKATEIYPQYDAAYTNLGMAYFSSGDTDQAREAFARAAEINPQNVKASRNLARILLKQKKYSEAQLLLERSLSVEPSNPESLSMLAALFFQSGNWQQALANARRVHLAPHDGFSTTHLIAARSLEHLNQPQDAVLEYKMFLKESPDSPHAVQVRKALAQAEAANRSPQ
jgi:tetratricopeptide (TPR) repeat protein